MHQQDIEAIVRFAANISPARLKRRRVREWILHPIADHNDRLTQVLAGQIRLDRMYRPDSGGVDPESADGDATPEAKLEILALAMRKGIGGRGLTNMANALGASPTEAWERARTSGERAESTLGNAVAAVSDEQEREEARWKR